MRALIPFLSKNEERRAVLDALVEPIATSFQASLSCVEPGSPAGQSDVSVAEQIERDLSWVQRIVEGDREAFRQLYRDYAPLMYKRLLRLLGDEQRAEECLQQVFVEVVDKIHLYQGQGVLHAWLNKMTTNCVLQLFRKERRTRDFLSRFASFWRVKESWGEQESMPEHWVVREERKQLVRRVLSQMEPAKRIVVLLCDIEGQSLAAVADQLEIPKGTVASRLHHARRELCNRIRCELKQCGTSVEDWIYG